jgi:cysteine desulfurase/selenocysteine lyase
MQIEHQIQDDFPILDRITRNGKRIVYLDSTASSQRPRPVIEAIRAYYEDYNANIHRGIYEISERATIEYEKAHKKVSDFIGADFEEVIFTRNTTESLNLVMYSYGMSQIKKNDDVVVSYLEHHSNFVPWQQLCKIKGANFKIIPVNDQGELIMEEAEHLISNRTKILAVAHVSNALGTINPIKDLIKLALENNATTIIDGAQSAPHLKIDMKDLNCDFFAFSGHKMLAPTGIGALYGKKEILEDMPPFLYGGDMISQVQVDQTSWNELPWKFEAGTTNIAGGIGFGAAVDYLKTIGMERIQKIEHDLLNYSLKRFEELDFVETYGPPPERRAGIVSFNVKGVHSHDVASILDENGVCIRAGHHCAQPLLAQLGLDATSRASFYVYNTRDDVDALIEGLLRVKELFDI